MKADLVFRQESNSAPQAGRCEPSTERHVNRKKNKKRAKAVKPYQRLENKMAPFKVGSSHRSKTELFVFSIGMISAVQGLIAPQSRDKCQALESCSGKKPLPLSCPKPGFLEHVGPPEMMPWILKQSDGVKISIGLQNPSELWVPLKYQSIDKIENNFRKMEVIYNEANAYSSRHCRDVAHLVYEPSRDIFYPRCPIIYHSQCYLELREEVEHYDSLIKEIFLYYEDHGFYSEFQKELQQALINRNEAISRIAGTLRSSVAKVRSDVEKTLQGKGANNKKKKAEYAIHSKFYDNKFAEIRDIYIRGEFENIKKQCIKRVSSCSDAQKIAEAKKTEEKIIQRRKELEAYRKSILMKTLETIGTTVSLVVIGVITIPLTLISLPKSITTYRRKTRRINAEMMLARIINERDIDMHKLDNTIKECEKASEKKAESPSLPSSIFFPQSWEEIDTSQYCNPKYKYKRKASKTDKKAGFLSRFTELVRLPERLDKKVIPAYPWVEPIPSDHDCVKRIYRRGFQPKSKMDEMDLDKATVAYAFFDKKSEIYKSRFSDKELAKLTDIHESGRYASHEEGATGYKCFKEGNQKGKSQLTWEFKIKGNQRVYGFPVSANQEGMDAGVPSLVIFGEVTKK